MFDRFLSTPWALNMLELEHTRVVNMPRFRVNCILKIVSILNVLSSEYAKVWNVSGVQCAVLRVLSINTSSYLFDRILNILRFQNMSGF